MKLNNLKSPLWPLIAGVGIRFAHIIAIADSPVLRTLVLDSQFYHRTALQIVKGDILGSSPFFMSPLYSYMLALLYAGFGVHVITAALFQVILSGITLWMLWRLGCIIAGERAGLVAAWGGALFPVWIYFDGVLLTASVILFLNTAALLILVHWFRDRKAWRLFLLGILLGLSALARPNILLFAVILIIWLILSGKHLAFIYIIMGMALMIIPVTVRNQLVTGELALTTVSGGMNFFVGNNPQATGLYVETEFIESSDPKSEFNKYLQEARNRSWKNLTPSGASHFWYIAGLTFLADHPLQWLKLWWNKFFYFWNNLEAPNNLSIFLVKRYSPILKMLIWGFGLLASTGLVGLFLLKRSDVKTALFLYLLSILASNIIYFTSSEFRFPVVNILLIGFGLFSVKIVELYRKRAVNWRLAVCTASLLLFTHFKTNLAKELSTPRIDYINLGSVLLTDDKPQEASEFFRKALRENPSAQDAHMKLGYALYDLKQYERAAAEFNQAGYPITPENLKKMSTMSDSLFINKR